MLATPQAKVRRDGQINSIPASGIVDSDILTLEAVDLLAAGPITLRSRTRLFDVQRGPALWQLLRVEDHQQNPGVSEPKLKDLLPNEPSVSPYA
jgi:hypothetical protein